MAVATISDIHAQSPSVTWVSQVHASVVLLADYM